MIPAALYVMPDSVYYDLLPESHCWDEARDAKLYDGPHPVVAHPPCGPWGRLRHRCTKQDPTCGPRAVEQVRELGGVLEHPAHSKLWQHCGLPKPNEFGVGFAPDYLSFTVEVNQVAWGHACRKTTWLYCVGIPYSVVASGLRRGGAPTHCVTKDAKRNSSKLPRCSARVASATPRAFAEWLVSLASVAVQP